MRSWGSVESSGAAGLTTIVETRSNNSRLEARKNIGSLFLFGFVIFSSLECWALRFESRGSALQCLGVEASGLGTQRVL